MERWTIYCHIHIDSGRRYVGLTKHTMLKRWNRHVYSANRSKGLSHFANAIRKYGKDAFSHEVLEVCNTVEEANAAEQRWISHFDTTNPERGFNLIKGGSHTPHPIKNPWDRPEYREKNLARAVARLRDPEVRAKGRAALSTPDAVARFSQISKEIHSRPEVREKLRRSAVGRTHSPETRALISEIVRARPQISEETRVRLSQSSTGRRHTPETRARISALKKGRKPSPKAMENSAISRRAMSSAIPYSVCRIHGHHPKKRGRNGHVLGCPECSRQRVR